MNDPLIYMFAGYVVGVVLGLLAGWDALLRAGRADVHITSKREAARWLLCNHGEAEK